MSNISLFIDSGAYSLYTEKVQKSKDRDKHKFFETDEFWSYVDEYAEFLKSHKKDIDTYVNVDVLFKPESSWKVQKYLEDKYGLSPMPVIHFGAPLYWIEKYLNDPRYDYIGLGGSGQVSSINFMPWADAVFELICDTPDRLPKVKVHGFALTSPRLMLRYPWYSVDSTSWLVFSRMGRVLIPTLQRGEHVYNIGSQHVVVTSRPFTRVTGTQHLNDLSPMRKAMVFEYFKEKGFKLGKSEFVRRDKEYMLKEGERWVKRNFRGMKEQVVEVIVEEGLSNCTGQRNEINMMYYVDLEKSMPRWPRPFHLSKMRRTEQMI